MQATTLIGMLVLAALLLRREPEPLARGVRAERALPPLTAFDVVEDAGVEFVEQ